MPAFRHESMLRSYFLQLLLFNPNYTMPRHSCKHQGCEVITQEHLEDPQRHLHGFTRSHTHAKQQSALLNHPNFKVWEETSLKVSRDTLERYKTLRHILNVWNADKVSDVKNKRLDYIFKENKMYNLAKLLREEISN